MYISPDYPTAGSTNISKWFQVDNPMQQQGFFYGGYNAGYPGAGDPNSRINQTSFNNNQSPYQNQPNQYAYGQQNTTPAVQPLQPFSSYGGSGQQTVMPTLNAPTMFNQPVQQNPFQNQQIPVTSMPTFAQPVQQNQAPLFNLQIPTLDKRQELWNNQYTQPQQIPVPQIDWNTPVQQPQYVNPMQSFQSFPNFNQPQQTFTDNWVDMFKRNLGVSL